MSPPGWRTGITGAGPRGALGPFRGVAGHDDAAAEGGGGGIALKMLPRYSLHEVECTLGDRRKGSDTRHGADLDC